MTVNRVLKRLEEAQDGAPVLQMDVPEPEPVAEDLEPELLQARASPIPPAPPEAVKPLVAKVAQDLGITVDAARVMVDDAQRRSLDREAEWARRRSGPEGV